MPGANCPWPVRIKPTIQISLPKVCTIWVRWCSEASGRVPLKLLGKRSLKTSGFSTGSNHVTCCCHYITTEEVAFVDSYSKTFLHRSRWKIDRLPLINTSTCGFETVSKWFDERSELFLCLNNAGWLKMACRKNAGHCEDLWIGLFDLIPVRTSLEIIGER